MFDSGCHYILDFKKIQKHPLEHNVTCKLFKGWDNFHDAFFILEIKSPALTKNVK